MCAAVCCAVLYGWFFLTVRYGMGVPDEAFYLTIPRRLLQGDRFLLEEWHLSQFTAVFQLLPYAAYTGLTGGTDGIILFMRYLYLAMSFTSYWYIFIKLRKTPWRALLCAVCFCGFVPFAVFAPNYYTLPPFFLLGSCFLLYGEKARSSGARPILAGAFFACAVLVTPALTAAYILYTALAFAVLLARRKGRSFLADYAFVLDFRVWLFFFFGVLAGAALFLGYLQMTSGFGAVLENLPNLLSDSEYNVGAGGNVWGFLLQKIQNLFDYFRAVAVVFPLIAAGSVFAARRFSGTKRPRYLMLLLALINTAAFVAACVMLWVKRDNDPLVFHSIAAVPLFCFGGVCYALCANKNRKLFLLWWCGLAFSLAKDALSDISVGFGCVLGAVPAAWHLLELVAEISAGLRGAPGSGKCREKNKTRLRLLNVAAVFMVACAVMWNGVLVFAEGWRCNYESELHPFISDVAEVEKGPYRGLLFARNAERIHAEMLADVTRINEMRCGPVYVSSLAPWCYLCLEEPCAAYSSWWIHDDAAERQLAYWRAFPEKRPGVIYVPDYAVFWEAAEYNGEPFERIKQYVRYEELPCAAGRLYRITEWLL